MMIMKESMAMRTVARETGKFLLAVPKLGLYGSGLPSTSAQVLLPVNFIWNTGEKKITTKSKREQERCQYRRIGFAHLVDLVQVGEPLLVAAVG